MFQRALEYCWKPYLTCWATLYSSGECWVRKQLWLLNLSLLSLALKVCSAAVIAKLLRFSAATTVWQLWAEHTSHTTASKLLPLRPNPNSNNYAFSAAPSFRSQLLLKNFSPPSVRPHFFRLKSPTTKLTRDKLKPLNTASASKEARGNQAKLLIAKMTNKFLLQNELLQGEWTIMVVRWLCRKIHTGYQTRFCYIESLLKRERPNIGYFEKLDVPIFEASINTRVSGEITLHCSGDALLKQKNSQYRYIALYSRVDRIPLKRNINSWRSSSFSFQCFSSNIEFQVLKKMPFRLELCVTVHISGYPQPRKWHLFPRAQSNVRVCYCALHVVIDKSVFVLTFSGSSATAQLPDFVLRGRISLARPVATSRATGSGLASPAGYRQPAGFGQLMYVGFPLTVT